jgi:hypothetical protein
MSEDDFFDSDKAAAATTKMWRELGEQIATAVPDIVIGGEPVKAVQWATCAEACFWKATGECDTHDVKDVLGVKVVVSDETGKKGE